MKKISIAAAFTLASLCTFAQKGKLFKGMYLQWGYNLDAYTKSTIHFKLSNGDNFILHKATAHDRPTFHDIIDNPTEISLPQYNYRIGFYLNESHTKAIEINFDHIKYVMRDGQTVHVTGTIGGKPVNGDSVVESNRFLHFEHTDGGNLLHINFVRQHNLLMSKKNNRPLLNLIWKAGAGINIPRTDFTYHGDRLNNNFHIAGYNAGVEAGVRYYFLKRLFLEGTGKTGYVKYLNALANTTQLKGNRVRHSFGYVEAIMTLGYDFKF
jgi:hypothetical protein